MPKPIIRYTVSGNCSEQGLHVFEKSIIKCVKIYPDFIVIACHNNLTKKLKKIINRIPADAYNSELYTDMEYLPQKEMWKMYPPRIDKSRHEIIIDNDLVLLDRIKQIDSFLKSRHNLLLRGRARSYGKYDHLVPQPFAFNSGFYGMYPNFDFKKYIEIAIKSDKNRQWENWCDDQGIISFALTQTNFDIIENNTIKNFFIDEDAIIPIHIKGLHIIGVNKNLQSKWKNLLYSNLIKNI